jgi:hypothetical protein
LIQSSRLAWTLGVTIYKERFMSSESPSFKTPVSVLTILIAPCLWYFEWATWAWLVAGLMYAVVGRSWLSEALKAYRAKQPEAGATGIGQPQNDFSDLSIAEMSSKWTEDDDVRATASQRGVEDLWRGRKEVEFIYRNMGKGSFLSFKVMITEVIAPEFADDEETYFKGLTANGEQRYFCLRFVKGKKVTDTVSGEVGTLRKILGVKRRVYK